MRTVIGGSVKSAFIGSGKYGIPIYCTGKNACTKRPVNNIQMYADLSIPKIYPSHLSDYHGS